MPKRLLFVTLVAAALAALPMSGQAQLAPRNRDTAPAPANYGNQGGYGAPGGYGGPGGYGTAGAGAGGYNGVVPTMAIDPLRKLQPGDQLSFKIEEDRDPGSVLVVSQSGDVIVEPLPQPVRVASLTVSSAAAEITRLLERDYYHKASVRLNLEKAGEIARGLVTLSGAVNRVGPLPLWPDRPMTVSTAINASGGFGKFADDRKVKVTRAGRSGTGTPDSFIVDVKEVLTKGRVDLDREVMDGDRIFVPEKWIH